MGRVTRKKGRFTFGQKWKDRCFSQTMLDTQFTTLLSLILQGEIFIHQLFIVSQLDIGILKVCENLRVRFSFIFFFCVVYLSMNETFISTSMEEFYWKLLYILIFSNFYQQKIIYIGPIAINDCIKNGLNTRRRIGAVGSVVVFYYLSSGKRVRFSQFTPWPRKMAIGPGNTFTTVPGRVILLRKDFFRFILYRGWNFFPHPDRAIRSLNKVQTSRETIDIPRPYRYAIVHFCNHGNSLHSSYRPMHLSITSIN